MKFSRGVLLLVALGRLGALCAWAQSPPATHAAVADVDDDGGAHLPSILVSVQGAQVTLRLATGQMATIPLTRLSPPDQLAVQAPPAALLSPPGSLKTRSAALALPDVRACSCISSPLRT